LPFCHPDSAFGGRRISLFLNQLFNLLIFRAIRQLAKRGIAFGNKNLFVIHNSLFFYAIIFL